MAWMASRLEPLRKAEAEDYNLTQWLQGINPANKRNYNHLSYQAAYFLKICHFLAGQHALNSAQFPPKNGLSFPICSSSTTFAQWPGIKALPLFTPKIRLESRPNYKLTVMFRRAE